MSTDGYCFLGPNLRQYWVRADMVEALQDYVQNGVPLGGFLRAVVCNDFLQLAQRADAGNLANLPAFAAYVSNEMPAACHGSEELYKDWIIYHSLEREHKRGPL